MFNLVVEQQWNFRSHAGTLYLHLRITSAPTWLVVASSNQLKPVWCSLVCMTKIASHGFSITSSLDFDKGSVI